MDEHNHEGHEHHTEHHHEEQAPPKESGDLDISRKTLVILVVLSVSISLIGALAMVYQLSNVHVAPIISENGGQDAAEVTFTIRSGDEPVAETASTATGMVSLEING